MTHTFVRWVRSGVAAALGDQPRATGSARRATLTVGVDVAAADLPAQVASADLSVLGPGDVTGIDPRQVIRTFPVANALDFEPTFYAHVELDRPDLPWLFTPFGPTTKNTLRPWICLVVVERGEHVELTRDPAPALKVTGPEIAQLPNLDETHLWAHVQLNGSGGDVRTLVENAPEQTRSRLICPRHLQPGTAYLACVVPTFAIGAYAGLGRAVPETVPLNAWSRSDRGPVELPVYHYWEFATGGDGDFRSLVLRLEPRATLPGVGTRPLDVSQPGLGLHLPASPAVALGGVFRVEEPASSPVDEDLAVELERLVNDPDAFGPPIYGRWHAAATSVAVPIRRRVGWLEALNLDPRHRVAAALGTQVIQDRQEDLMASIWEQLGELGRANQLLTHGQLAVAASARIATRHLASLPDPILLLLAGPAAARIRVEEGLTLRGAAAVSCLPIPTLSGAFRKLVRVHGPIDRRLRRLEGMHYPDLPPPPALDLKDIVEKLAAGTLAGPAPQLPDGAVSLPAQIRNLPWLRQRMRSLSGAWQRFRSPSRWRQRETGTAATQTGPLDDLGSTLALLSQRAARSACIPLDVGAMANAIRTAIDPNVAIAGRVRSQVSLPGTSRVQLSARLDPIMAAPEIPTPMIGPLQELGPEWLLPGIDAIPPNTVTLAEPNRQLIESYMVGLNHEMGRELLWRGFPTDQRGTVLSRFWDRRGAVATPAQPVPDQDIAEIHTWKRSSTLGSHLTSGNGPGPVVLLVRGDLLHRYPRATVYVRQASWIRNSAGKFVFTQGAASRHPAALTTSADWDAHVLFPQFTGAVGGDIAFYGFGLDRERLRGLEPREAPADVSDDQAGWYVVFEEQPTEPRFGEPTQTPPVWPPHPPLTPTDKSEEFAEQRLRNSFRLFVHASDLVPS